MPSEQPETVEVTTDTGEVVEVTTADVADAMGVSVDTVNTLASATNASPETVDAAIAELHGIDPAEGESQQADVVYAANGKDFVAVNRAGNQLYGRIEDGQQTYLSTEPRPGAIYPD